MGFPIATKASGMICFAFPDICNTPSSTGQVAIPYPNIGQLSQAQQVSDASRGKGEVKVNGDHVILAGDNGSEIPQTTGDEGGSIGGVRSGMTRGKVTFPQGSSTVTIQGLSVVRMTDSTQQNDDNANGVVLGGVPNVLVGG